MRRDRKNRYEVQFNQFCSTTHNLSLFLLRFFLCPPETTWKALWINIFFRDEFCELRKQITGIVRTEVLTEEESKAGGFGLICLGTSLCASWTRCYWLLCLKRLAIQQAGELIFDQIFEYLMGLESVELRRIGGLIRFRDFFFNPSQF